MKATTQNSCRCPGNSEKRNIFFFLSAQKAHKCPGSIRRGRFSEPVYGRKCCENLRLPVSFQAILPPYHLGGRQFCMGLNGKNMRNFSKPLKKSGFLTAWRYEGEKSFGIFKKTWQFFCLGFEGRGQFYTPQIISLVRKGKKLSGITE